jgi:hypothetical protein
VLEIVGLIVGSSFENLQKICSTSIVIDTLTIGIDTLAFPSPENTLLSIPYASVIDTLASGAFF